MWITSFLRDRRQTVHINDSCSNKVKITSGVPQGSVLGPILFLMYIDDISKISSGKCKSYLFADDYKVYSSNLSELQNTLDNLLPFTHKRQLTLAPSKCNHFIVTKKNDHTKLSLDGVNLEQTFEVKDLGVFVSSNLKWDLHISKIRTKALHRCFHIFRSFSTNNVWTLLRAYKVFVRPVLESNSVLWNPYLLKDIHALESVQRFFLKRVCRRCNIPSTDYCHRLRMVNMKSLEYRRLEFDLFYAYKIRNNLVYVTNDKFFKPWNTPYDLRGNPNKIYEPVAKTGQTKHFFTNRIIKVWNRLPPEISESPTLQAFKYNIRSADLKDFLVTDTA